MRKIILIALAMVYYIPSSFAQLDNIAFSIFHTNDTHANYYGNYNKRIQQTEYGFIYQLELLERARNIIGKDKVLLLSGGDVNTGAPESDIFHAEPDFRAMDIMGYDAMVLGNHEFDNVPDILNKQSKFTSFPFLAANLQTLNNQPPSFKPYIVKTIAGHKVLIIGLLTDEVRSGYKGFYLNSDKIIPAYNIEDEVEWAKKNIARIIQQERPSFTILLTHIGYYPPGSAKSNETKGDLYLARELSRSNIPVDLIIGGHSQKLIVNPDITHKIPIVQAGEMGKFVGHINVLYDANTKKLSADIKNYSIYSINYTPVKTDFARPIDESMSSKIIPRNNWLNINYTWPSYNGAKNRPLSEESVQKIKNLRGLVKNFYSKYPHQLNKNIGHLDSLFNGRPSGGGKETNLGRLIAHSWCNITKSDVCFINNGGVRADIDSGPVQFQEVLRVLPDSFKNTLCTYWATGEELTKFFSDYLIPKQHKPGSPLHFHGINLVIEQNKSISNITIKKKTPPNLIALNENSRVKSNRGYERNRTINMAKILVDGNVNPQWRNVYFKVASSCRLIGNYNKTDTELPDYLTVVNYLEKRFKKNQVIRSDQYSTPSIIQK